MKYQIVETFRPGSPNEVAEQWESGDRETVASILAKDFLWRESDQQLKSAIIDALFSGIAGYYIREQFALLTVVTA